MGPQYQAAVDSYAASPQATQAAGNQTLGKAMEQSPIHDGFGTRSSSYDNGMDVSAQPAPVATPPQPINQPASAGINPSWAQQKGRKRGGRAKRANGGPLGLFSGQVSPLMMTGDTIAALGNAPSAVAPQSPTVQTSAPPQGAIPDTYSGQYIASTPGSARQGMSNADFLAAEYQNILGRAPDAGGYKYWSDILSGGQANQSQIEDAFLRSPEAAKVLPGIMAERNKAANTPQARQAMLAQGILPDQAGSVDPFVAMYNARVNAAQDLYGGIAQRNFQSNQGAQQEYQAKLAELQKANEARLEQARIAKAQREDRQRQEAENARNLAMMMMFMR